jgi:hypothetical protein
MHTIDKPILSKELNIPMLDVDKIKITILPLVEIQKARIEGSIKKIIEGSIKQQSRFKIESRQIIFFNRRKVESHFKLAEILISRNQ